MQISSPNKEYHKSNTTMYSCVYHVIFTPKYRRPVLVNEISDRLKEIIQDVVANSGNIILEMEIMPDHVHLLLDVNPDYGIGQLIRDIKGTSSRLLRSEFSSLKSRLPTLWTRSKFVSSVGSVSLEVVKQYIQDQKGK